MSELEATTLTAMPCQPCPTKICNNYMHETKFHGIKFSTCAVMLVIKTFPIWWQAFGVIMKFLGINTPRTGVLGFKSWLHFDFWLFANVHTDGSSVLDWGPGFGLA